MKPPKIIHLESLHGSARVQARALLATVCLGMRNVRPNARRGLVGTRDNASDHRGIADVPDFTCMNDAWRLLNYFAHKRFITNGKDPVSALFYQLASDCWFDSSADAYVLAVTIADAALTTVRYGQAKGWV